MLYIIISLFLTHSAIAKPTILILGDSLSASYQIPPESGWVALLEAKLKKDFPQVVVFNGSIVGNTTSNGLEQLPALLNQHKPDIVVLELGGNDGLRGIPVERIRKNLEQMIQLSTQANAKVLLVGIRMPPNYGGPYGRNFYQIYTDLAKQYSLAFVPFFLEGVVLRPGLMFPDRIHPTQKAQPILLENIWDKLSPLLED